MSKHQMHNKDYKMSLFVAHKREESLLSNPKTWYTCFTHTKKNLLGSDKLKLDFN